MVAGSVLALFAVIWLEERERSLTGSERRTSNTGSVCP